MIWKLRVQQRVRVFVWLLALEEMLTNACRWRRKLIDNPVCMRCLWGMEDEVHVTGDCVSSKEVWNCFSPSRLISRFFTMDLQEWLEKNLSWKRIESWGGSLPETMAII